MHRRRLDLPCPALESLADGLVFPGLHQALLFIRLGVVMHGVY